MHGFALTGVNSGALAIADNETATATKPAAAINRAERPRNLAIEETIVYDRDTGEFEPNLKERQWLCLLKAWSTRKVIS